MMDWDWERIIEGICVGTLSIALAAGMIWSIIRFVEIVFCS